MKLASSGQLPGSLVRLAQYSEFYGHLSVGRAGPPGPPLSGEKGPPGRSRGVTDFCSGFLPHFPPSTFSPWPGLVGIPVWPYTALFLRGQGEAHPLHSLHGQPLPFQKLWALLPWPSRSPSPHSLPRSAGAGDPWLVEGLCGRSKWKD